MPEPMVLVDVKLTRLAAAYDRIYVVWSDLGPHRLPTRPVHALLSNPPSPTVGAEVSAGRIGVGPAAGAGARRPVPAGVPPLAAALAAAPPASSFDPDATADGLGRLFTAAGRTAAPWPGVVDLRALIGDRLGGHRPPTLAAACATTGCAHRTLSAAAGWRLRCLPGRAGPARPGPSRQGSGPGLHRRSGHHLTRPPTGADPA